MKKFLLICCLVCLTVGFFLGRSSIKVKEVTRYVQGKTIRDTITNLVPDTVCSAGKLEYKYVYKIDTVYKDIHAVDREATIENTIRDWNLTRDYKKILFDNENGNLSVDLSVRYNELQRLSYTFTPVYKETTILKKKVFAPFVSVTCVNLNSFSIGGGFFYLDLGLRVELASGGFNWGVMYKF